MGAELEATETTVTVRNGRIAAIGNDPDDLPSFDLSGMTLLPGFIDTHVHIGFANPAEVLWGGVTTVRDLAWPPDVIFPQVEEAKASPRVSPTILAAGPMLTVAGGYPTRATWAPPGTALVVDGPRGARTAVQEVAARGASVIKVALNAQVGPTLDLATLTAIVEEAHGLQSKVTGHVYGLEELNKALDAGMDELAHMLMSNERLPQGTIERMVFQGMAVVPTLSVRFGEDRVTAIENLARFMAAGGEVIYGTDLGNEGPRPGIDPFEIDAMTESGMDGAGIIAAATVDAARWLGLQTTGVIAEGMNADLVAVAGDPLRDPQQLLDVRLVVHEGEVVREP